MALSQVIVFMDSAGVVRAEAPGFNGQRVKIDLEPGFLDRNPELRAELVAQQDRAKRIVPAPKAEYRDPEIERRRVNNEIARQRLEADRRWLDSLPDEAREYELQKREQKRQAIIDAENDRAREIWRKTAKHHSIDLANTVISDPARRPNQRIKVRSGIYDYYGKEVIATYNPRFDQSPKTEGKKRVKKSTLPNIKLNLDLGL